MAAKSTKSTKATKSAKPGKAAKSTKRGSALQTVRTKASVDGFLRKVAAERQADCREIIAMMSQAAGSPAEMWGPAIIGFGKSTYRYPDGRTMDWMLVAFSPRKTEFVLYLSDFDGKPALMQRLGKHKTGKACLYVKRLEEIDRGVLRQLVTKSVAAARKEDA